MCQRNIVDNQEHVLASENSVVSVTDGTLTTGSFFDRRGALLKSGVSYRATRIPLGKKCS